MAVATAYVYAEVSYVYDSLSGKPIFAQPGLEMIVS